MRSKEVQQGTARPTTPDSNVPVELPKTPETQIGRAVNITSPLPYNTPITRNENSCKDSFQEQDAEARYLRLAKELLKWITGPMPTEEFIDTFLPSAEPSPDHLMPSAVDAFKCVPANPKKERQIYEAIVSFLATSSWFIFNNVYTVLRLQYTKKVSRFQIQSYK